MRQTVLEMVQDILLDLNSFPVNSITETVESEQVAAILRRTYYDIVSQRNWANTKQVTQLSSATALMPTHLALPSGVKQVSKIMYDVRLDVAGKLKYQSLTYMTPEQFLEMSAGLDSTAANVDTVTDTNGATLLVRNDKQPQYWTSFDDAYVVCDSYYSAVDSFLQNSKTQALVVVTPAWTHDDAFYPVLPEEAFPYLLAEALSRASMSIKGVPHEKAEQASNRLRKIMSQKHWALNSGDRYPNYGRGRPARSKNPYLEK